MIGDITFSLFSLVSFALIFFLVALFVRPGAVGHGTGILLLDHLLPNLPTVLQFDHDQAAFDFCLI